MHQGAGNGSQPRIDVSWLSDEFKGNSVELAKTPSDEMAADIFTKPFPDCKAHVWEHDLKLIRVVEPHKYFTAPEFENAAGGQIKSMSVVHVQNISPV